MFVLNERAIVAEPPVDLFGLIFGAPLVQTDSANVARHQVVPSGEEEAAPGHPLGGQSVALAVRPLFVETPRALIAVSEVGKAVVVFCGVERKENQSGFKNKNY